MSTEIQLSNAFDWRYRRRSLLNEKCKSYTVHLMTRNIRRNIFLRLVGWGAIYILTEYLSNKLKKNKSTFIRGYRKSFISQSILIEAAYESQNPRKHTSTKYVCQRTYAEKEKWNENKRMKKWKKWIEIVFDEIKDCFIKTNSRKNIYCVKGKLS